MEKQTKHALKGGNGIIYGKDDNLLKKITSCIITEVGDVVVSVEGSTVSFFAFDTLGAIFSPDDIIGMTISEAREFRDSRLKN